MSADHRFEAELWRHEGPDAWVFVTLPAEVADEVRDRFDGRHRPFGSLAVEATIGGTTWRTSLFADRKAGSYLLPVKADVRRRTGLDDGDRAEVALRFAD